MNVINFGHLWPCFLFPIHITFYKINLNKTHICKWIWIRRSRRRIWRKTISGRKKSMKLNQNGNEKQITKLNTFLELYQTYIFFLWLFSQKKKKKTLTTSFVCLPLRYTHSMLQPYAFGEFQISQPKVSPIHDEGDEEYDITFRETDRIQRLEWVQADISRWTFFSHCKTSQIWM